ncbi:hypothetical protein L0244_07790 [bacterium]|nr:hypothetical protein [bacterium]MCI0612877.1 hypothetical protein [bacterium]
MRIICWTILALSAAAVYVNAKDVQQPIAASVLGDLKAGNQRQRKLNIYRAT